MDRPGHLLRGLPRLRRKRAANMLLASGEETIDVKQSKNPYDWLGAGAYFFEDDWKRALLFAQTANEHPGSSKGAIKTAAVIGAVIRVHRWLDWQPPKGVSSTPRPLTTSKPKARRFIRTAPVPINWARTTSFGSWIGRSSTTSTPCEGCGESHPTTRFVPTFRKATPFRTSFGFSEGDAHPVRVAQSELRAGLLPGA